MGSGLGQKRVQWSQQRIKRGRKRRSRRGRESKGGARERQPLDTPQHHRCF